MASFVAGKMIRLIIGFILIGLTIQMILIHSPFDYKAGFERHFQDIKPALEKDLEKHFNLKPSEGIFKSFYFDNAIDYVFKRADSGWKFGCFDRFIYDSRYLQMNYYA